MDLGFILLAVALTGLVIFIVAQPFFDRQVGGAAPSGDAAALTAERDAILSTVRDLDFDHATGKITDEDYAAQRADLMAQGADVLKRLDAAGAVEATDAIELAIAARRQTVGVPAAGSPAPGSSTAQPAAGSPVPTCPDCGAVAAPGARFCAQCGAALGRVCAQCSAQLAADDRFCGACGAAVAEEARS